MLANIFLIWAWLKLLFLYTYVHMFDLSIAPITNILYTCRHIFDLSIALITIFYTCKHIFDLSIAPITIFVYLQTYFCYEHGCNYYFYILANIFLFCAWLQLLIFYTCIHMFDLSMAWITHFYTCKHIFVLSMAAITIFHILANIFLIWAWL